jgi:exo-beta-1,3-glucanase (GH17 family)
MSALRVALLGLLAPALAIAAAVPQARATCHVSQANAPALARLREALSSGRFVSYQPTSLQVVNGQVGRADASSIRADLTVLREKFDSLITYDSVHGAEGIPAIASQLKFRALIIGVWNPLEPSELDAAVGAAQQYPQLVVGVALGNELIFSHRAAADQLATLAAQLRRRSPQLLLSVSEPFHIYGEPGAAALLGQLDFLLPNVHPVFQPWFHGASAATSAQFVVNVVSDFGARFCGPVLVKETGVPTAPADGGFSEAGQAAFYHELRRRFPATRARAFAYFSAFDAPWRAQDVTPVGPARPEEAHWGLYDAARKPKRAARELPAYFTANSTVTLSPDSGFGGALTMNTRPGSIPPSASSTP